MKICAVVVTFNRKDLLKECLKALLVQTQRLDKIFVIDNASTDGTSEELTNNFSGNEAFEFIRSEKNLGGAGGFNLGVKTAIEQGFDWIWMMDDDVEPKHNALEGMMKFSGKSLCLHPSKKFEDGSLHSWNGEFLPQWGLTIWKNENFREKESFTKINYGCFEGMLIHRSIIEKIGLPDERFFIVGDDLIYGHLASKHTDVLYLRDPVIIKKIYPEYCSFLGIKRVKRSLLYYFFRSRNLFLMRKILLEQGDGSALKTLLGIIFELSKLVVDVIFFQRKILFLSSTWHGLLDGIKGRFVGQLPLSLFK